MFVTLFYLFYGLTTALIGSLLTLCISWSYFHRNNSKNNADVETRQAAGILVRLQDLATRIAVDVDDHSSRIGEINDKLTTLDDQRPVVVVDVVAKLIEANQQMQKRLATTEDKLRKQAREIEIHAAEARTDALTLLANRRSFDDELTRRVAEYRRLGRTFSLIMADVDKFKKFNDAHGHQTGDEVLQGVAKVLRRTMREMDLVARYGGEEYAIILPGTILEDACKAAARARMAIDKSYFQNALQVTLSFGVAEVLKLEDGSDIIGRADKALYAAKEGGRNCVYKHDGTSFHCIDSVKHDELPKTETQQPSIPAPEPDTVNELPSRTNFCQHVRNQTTDWKRGGLTFSVLLIEANQNDQEAKEIDPHARKVTSLITTNFLVSTIRESDLVGHYAPGCFALLLPKSELVDAIRDAERLREGFLEYTQSLHGDQSITLSVGVVQIMESDESMTLLKRAEEALDAANRRGGNRTYYHDGKRWRAYYRDAGDHGLPFIITSTNRIIGFLHNPNLTGKETQTIVSYTTSAVVFRA